MGCFHGKEKEISAVFLITFCVAVSGCLSAQETGDGVVIKEFKPDFSTAFSGEPVQFFMLVKNTGSEAAADMRVCVTGLGGGWVETGRDDSCVDCGDSSSGFGLFPPSENVAGEEKSCVWSYRSPNIAKGMQMTYEAKGRVYYRYKSATVKSITILPQREMKDLENRGEALPSETTSSTRGPVMITIENRGPIRYWESKLSFPLAIRIDNTGSGVTEMGGKDGKPTYNLLNLKITFPNENKVTMAECKDFDKQFGVIELWDGKSALVNCELTYDLSEFSNVAVPVQKSIMAEAEYYYVIEKSFEINVVGR
jgi:hypothetical protein